VNVDCLNVDACVHYVTTESELKPDLIKKESYEKLLQQYHSLETHCISLEVNNQLNMEIFQRDNVSSSEKKIKFFSGDVKERKVEKEVEEIETLNLELDHKVTKLTAENEHLKQTYKQLFDSIKSSRVQSKEHYDDLINKVSLKSVEVSDLNASLQEKVLVITALKEQLSKLKGKAVLTKVVSLNLIDPVLLQVDVVPLVPKLRKNRTAHIDYIRHTQEEAATLRELVESERLLSPLNTSLAYACKSVKREVEEIETLNIELDHKVTKLVAENEHLKQTHKQLYDSTKSSRVRSKEQCDDLINKVNLKSAEVFDLNASLQEKFLVITTLKEQLNKLKGKVVLTEAVSLNPIDPELLKVDVAPLVLKLRKNRTAHTDYIRHTQEEAATLREIVEKKLNSLNGDVEDRDVIRNVKESETLNIKLGHQVTKLATENNHLKQTYKQLYDSIKSSRVRSKEQCDELIKKVNLKSAEVSDLNVRLQEKVLVITALKEQLDKLKGKAVSTEAVSLNPINPKLLKVDVTPVVSKLRKNRTAHIEYIRHTQGEAATLRKIVESERFLSPLNTSLDYACYPNCPLKFLGTVKFRNDHVAKIMGYGDYQIGNMTISRVYYVEGLGHNLFSIGQFCDSDLEVAFCQHTCFIRNLEGVDLLTGIQDQVLALASSLVTFELWGYQSSS
nr:integrase, catalytic region, zinc finger, CCHC-type, peptidase aspartic, catalytic [Tanacetum cinerariifolium]